MAARSPGQWDILAFGHDSSALVLAVKTAAVGYRLIRQSDTESSKQRGDCGWSGEKDKFFLIGVVSLNSELLPPPCPHCNVFTTMVAAFIMPFLIVPI